MDSRTKVIADKMIKEEELKQSLQRRSKNSNTKIMNSLSAVAEEDRALAPTVAEHASEILNAAASTVLLQKAISKTTEEMNEQLGSWRDAQQNPEKREHYESLAMKGLETIKQELAEARNQKRYKNTKNNEDTDSGFKSGFF